MNKEKSHVNLLWTGGWDSTFQLLQLLLIHKCEVTPYYTIHEERPSTGKELKVMNQIKAVLMDKYPFVKDLLNQTQYYGVGDIPSNEEISSAYNEILKKCHVGIQYEWLARFCQDQGIKEMQLSIQDHIKINPDQFNVRPMLLKKKIAGQDNFIIDPKFSDTYEYKIFKHFSFPLMRLTKLKMNEAVNKKGWREIMDMTWFCHTPTRSEKACGICLPCVIAIDESFGWRIPKERRLVSFYFRKVWWPVKSTIRNALINLGLYADKNKN